MSSLLWLYLLTLIWHLLCIWLLTFLWGTVLPYLVFLGLWLAGSFILKMIMLREVAGDG